MKIDKFTLPIYLNQKYVFDLLAIIDNGFSKMETIKSGNNSTNSENNNLKGEVGLSNTFAFLKLGVSADNKSEETKNKLEESTKEKIHTPNSLFSKMREYLHDNKLIKNSDFLNSKPGDFVEIKLSLRKSPIIDSLEAMLSIMRMAVSFENKPVNNNKSHHGQKNSNNNIIINQIESLLNQLKEEGSLDLIGTSTTDEKFQVVLTLDKSFIGELSLADIADGEFSVLGKVTKVIVESSSDEVNLLRKTSLSKLTNTLLEEMFSGFSNMEESGLKNLEIETVIKAPAIQLIPISIFT